MSKTLADGLCAVENFPKPGILFQDIGPLLADPKLLEYCIERLCALVPDNDYDVIVALGARGFLFGAPLALAVGKPLVMARKTGKLPPSTVIGTSYSLEYGVASVDLPTAPFPVDSPKRVLIVDDLLATGGSAEAVVKLVYATGSSVAAAVFVSELTDLHGRDKLDVPVHSLLHIDGDGVVTEV